MGRPRRVLGGRFPRDRRFLIEEDTPWEKRSWHLGWDGQQLFKNLDAAMLAHRWPEVEQWVISVLKRRPMTPQIFAFDAACKLENR
jgi:hypothetical protein